jgi:hypothetical protein
MEILKTKKKPQILHHKDTNIFLEEITNLFFLFFFSGLWCFCPSPAISFHRLHCSLKGVREQKKQ